MQPYYLRGAHRLLLRSEEDQQIEVRCVALADRGGELIRYAVRNSLGHQVAEGLLKKSAVIRFSADGGQNYFLDIQAGSSSYRLEVRGGHYAVTDLSRRGALHLQGETTPLYF